MVHTMLTVLAGQCLSASLKAASMSSELAFFMARWNEISLGHKITQIVLLVADIALLVIMGRVFICIIYDIFMDIKHKKK